MQRAIVTGGTRGIGLAVARMLINGGSTVMIVGRDGDRLEAARRDLASAGGDRVAAQVADVRDPVQAAAIVAETVRQFGGLDTVINNAGVGRYQPVESMSDEDWRSVIDTNLSGPFYVTRAAIPVLRSAGGGWIINVASLAARNAFPGGAAYCASKAALVAFSEAVMQEVRYDGIRVSAVLPGSVATEFSGARGSDDWKLSAEDVARVIEDLLRHPGRSLPSRVEIRPSQPPRKG